MSTNPRARIIVRLVPAEARAVFRALGWLQVKLRKTPMGLRLAGYVPFLDADRAHCPQCHADGVKHAKAYNITRAAHAARHMIEAHGVDPKVVSEALRKAVAPTVASTISTALAKAS